MDEQNSMLQLQDLLSIESNGACFDCGAPGPTWASLSHGSFVCLSCSGIHRGFGLSISFVKSINMDTWSSRQLMYMKQGGNENLRIFFDGCKITELPLSQRYKTVGAAYYRKRLRAIVDGAPLPPPIDPEVACRLEDQMGDALSASAAAPSQAVGSPPLGGVPPPAAAPAGFSSVNIAANDPVADRSTGSSGLSSPRPTQPLLHHGASTEERGGYQPLPQQGAPHAGGPQPGVQHAGSFAGSGARRAQVSGTKGDFLGSLGSAFGSFMHTAYATAEHAVHDIKNKGVIDQAKGAFETSKSWLEVQGKKLATNVQDPEWWETNHNKAKVEATKVACHLTHAASNAQSWLQKKVAEINVGNEGSYVSPEDDPSSPFYRAQARAPSGPIGVAGGANLWTEPKDPDADEVNPILEQYKK